ncbi:hypothetical protein GX50_08578 [[Emmonsia] crescens]|uniref:Protein ECM13 n=1 Tax=[Emmonsia] crescens TaxID=73230 RepID=A0A2B7Z520_9EURO|nr:hypothetical protein GX50_08578 [Emmonsia crescens]
MSLTQTYFLAHAARAKLSREASRPDHDLRILVGHANMLDSLMLELADAEREQEKWFNQSVRGANNKLSDEQHSKHIQWADSVVEEPEQDWDPEDLSSSDSDSDSEGSDSDDSDDYDEEDIFSPALLSRSQLQQVQPPSTPRITSREILRYADDDEAIEEDDDEDSDELALTRTHSRSQHQPPELLDDSDDSSSEDESLPRSPPQPTLDSFSGKGAVVTTGDLYSSKQQSSEPSNFATLSPEESDQSAALFEDGFFLPHQQERGAMIEAF